MTGPDGVDPRAAGGGEIGGSSAPVTGTTGSVAPVTGTTGSLEVVEPRPGEFTHADLLWAVAATLGVDLGGTGSQVEPGPLAGLAETGPRGVVVLVADGLGWHQLVDTDVAPRLAGLARQTTPIRAVLPSTTATNLVSIGTGRASGDHGILGYTMVVDGAVFNPLVWRFGLRGGGHDARAEVVPEALVPQPTLLERLHAAGVATTAVVHPDFLDSGLTRAGLRGGCRVSAVGAAETLSTALAATRGPGPAVVYAHHPDIDTAGHVAGPHSSEWRDAVANLDRRLGQLHHDLPDDVAVVVTADHGMVAVPDDTVTELGDGHPLLDGVALVAGEPRMRSLVLEPDVDPGPVVARLASTLGDRATVLTTDDAVARGWFGPHVPAHHRRRLGDVLVASHVGSVVHPRVDPLGGRLAGLHGGLTAAERDVPLLVITRS